MAARAKRARRTGAAPARRWLVLLAGFGAAAAALWLVAGESEDPPLHEIDPQSRARLERVLERAEREAGS